MKIISVENASNYGIYEDILIPCMIYKAPSVIKKNKKLNFLEMTIYKLKKINPSLLDDIEKLKKYLGFYSIDEKDRDYTQIITTAVQKIKDYRLDEEEEEEKILTFYQELYSGKLLPIVTIDPIQTTIPHQNISYKYNYIRKVKFKKMTKDIPAYWYSIKANITSITIKDAIDAVFKHNLKRYEEYPKIELTQVSKIPQKIEKILLHVRVYFLENGDFVLTDGFSGNYSSLFTDIFKSSKYYELIKILRENKKENKNSKNFQITLPYNIKDNTMKEKFIIIEKFSDFEYQNTIELNLKKEKLIIALFDLIEYALKCNKEEIHKYKDILKNENFLADIASSMGFKADAKLNIFHITNYENIKSYLGILLINKSKKLKNIAKINPLFIEKLNDLLYLRNALKHSLKYEIFEKIDKEKIIEYKHDIYMAIEILFSLHKENVKVDILTKDISFNNAYINLENSFDVSIWQKIPQDIKNMFVYVDYLLNEEDFLNNRVDIINSVGVNLSAIFEYLFKDIYKNFHFPNKIKKDIIINKYNITAPELVNVNIEKFESALNAQNASLGAYYLIYINFYGIDNKLFDLIIKLLRLRKHANISYEEAISINKEDLQKLYEETKKEVAKLIKERYDG